MRSFSEVYKTSKEAIKAAKNEQLELQRKEILAAMSSIYGVHDFMTLNESEKKLYKSLMVEYWNPQTGITKKGELLLNEARETLIPQSTQAQIKTYFKKAIHRNIRCCLKSLGGCKDCGDANVEAIIKKCNEMLKENKVETDTYKKWAYEQICDDLKEIFKLN